MIQKYITSRNYKLTSFTKPDKVNKNLKFFLLKKKFFLYKSFLKKKDTNKKFTLGEYLVKKPKTNNINSVYRGENLNFNYINRSLLSRIRTKLNLYYSYRYRRFSFFKIKKKFKSINKHSRIALLKLLKLKLKKPKLTKFLKNSKNCPKRLLIKNLIKHKKRYYFSIKKHLFLDKFFIKNYLISDDILDKTIISKSIQMRVIKFFLKKIPIKRRKFFNLQVKNSIFDPRQLMLVRYKSTESFVIADDTLLSFNAFNYRSYNWKILT